MDAVLGEENKQRIRESLEHDNHLDSNSQWPRKGPGLRDSAVLIPLLTVDGEPSILFTLRARDLSRHRNQVSFPGGMADFGDGTPIGTALRETHEELGIEPERVEVWGQLHKFQDRQRTSLITPVIGCLGNMRLDSLRLNKSEVASVFTLPISKLADPSIHRHTRFRTMPALRFPVFLGGPRRVWGVTAFILDMTLTRILPQHFNYVPIVASKGESLYSARTTSTQQT